MSSASHPDPLKPARPIAALPEHTGDSIPPEGSAHAPLALPEHGSDSDPDLQNGADSKKSKGKDTKAKNPEGKSEHKKGGKLVIIVGIALVAMAAVIVTVLALVHRHKAAKIEKERQAEVAKGPKLEVVKVQMSRPTREISLPGEVRGFNQATLYGKISGYVSEIRVDRGDVVKKGDILAVIESPEAHDDLISAQSNKEYTKRTAERLNILSPAIVSAIDRDNAVNAARMASANLERARTLFEYTLVRAPFDGVVTARYVDLGALVPAATSSTQQAQPVVDISEVDRVRVFTYLGQDAATFVKAGDQVAIYEDERPEQRVPATMTRVTGALDPRTRTMQCEIDIDNTIWHLIPGTFVHVRLAVEIPASPVVPDEALVTRDGLPHVAIIDGGKVHYVPVDIGNDDGKTTRILNGLKGGEMVGINVPVELDENDKVQTIAQKPAQANKTDSSAKGSPTSTPTSVTRPPPPGPSGVSEKNLEPNITSDNGGGHADAGR